MGSAASETVHVSVLAILARHLARRGHDVAAWRRAAELPDPAALPPDARVPIDAMKRAWRAAQALARDPALALHVGAEHSSLAHGLLGHLMAHSDTLGDAWRALCRHLAFASGGMRADLVEEGEVARLWLRADEPDPELWPWVAARTLAAIFTIAREQAGAAFSPIAVEWDFPAPRAARAETLRAHGDFFGTPVAFASRRCALVIAREQLALRLLHRDPALAAFFARQLEAAKVAPRPAGSIAARLRAALPGLIDRGEAGAAPAARALGLGLRSLHRTLAAEATTFQAELDAVRRARALWLVEQTAQPLEQIAFACGFADASGFHRAFKRWTGHAPRARQSGKPLQS